MRRKRQRNVPDEKVRSLCRRSRKYSEEVRALYSVVELIDAASTALENKVNVPPEIDQEGGNGNLKAAKISR
jgi:hypothetical protein